jgi:hypothetical protein
MQRITCATAVATLIWASAASQAAMVAYQPLDSTTGLTAGTPSIGTNDAAIVPGLFGNAASFDGNGDFFVVDAGSPITGGAIRTYAVWVNQSAGQTGLLTPMSFGSNGNGTKYDIDIDNAADGIEVGVGGGRTVDTGAGFVSDQWNLIVSTVPVAGAQVGQTVQYLNGVPRLSGTNTRPVATSSNRWLFGTAANVDLMMNPSIQFYSGLVDDASVWDEVLTGDEIVGMYDVGIDLGYTADLFELLKNVHDAGAGSVTIGTTTWSYADSLAGGAGLNGTTDSLVLNATLGTGLTGVVVPEPSTLAMLGLAGLFAAASGLRYRWG